MRSHRALFERIFDRLKAIGRKRLKRKLERAKELMGKPELSMAERIERDKIAMWLGKNGGWEGNALLKAWSTKGDVALRPDPDILGEAIAREGEDSAHLHAVAHYSVERELDFNSRYYFARLLAAECGALAREGRRFDPRRSVTYFICSGAEQMLRFIEKTEPALVEEFQKERKNGRIT